MSEENVANLLFDFLIVESHRELQQVNEFYLARDCHDANVSCKCACLSSKPRFLRANIGIDINFLAQQCLKNEKRKSVCLL